VFWDRIVRPRLEHDFGGVYRFLSAPIPARAQCLSRGGRKEHRHDSSPVGGNDSRVVYDIKAPDFRKPLLATITSAALQGIDAEPVHVEVNAGEVGEPGSTLVGLPDAAVEDPRTASSRLSATAASGRPARAPQSISRPVICAKKVQFMICRSLSASSSRPSNSRHRNSTSSSSRARLQPLRRNPVRCAERLAMARLARALGERGVLLPALSAGGASLVEGVAVYRVTSLGEAFRFLSGESRSSSPPGPANLARTRSISAPSHRRPSGFSEIRGPAPASAGRSKWLSAVPRDLLIIGPPGAGKSMVAKRLPTHHAAAHPR